MEKSTDTLKNELKGIKNQKQLDKWLKDNAIGRKTFGDYMVELLDKKGMTIADLVKKVPSVSQAYIYDCINGKKKSPSKEKVIRMGFGVAASVEEMNRLLKLSNLKELYTKNEADSIIIFGLENKMDIYEINLLLKERNLDISLFDEE